MKKLLIKRHPGLSVLITLSFLITLVVILIPGIWLIQSISENKLIQQKLSVQEQVNSAWISDLNIHFQDARKSVQRFSSHISQIPSTVASQDLLRFDRIIKKFADGAYRSDPKYFSPDVDSGIWLQKDHPVTEKTKSFFINAKTATDIYGQGALTDFADTWILPKEGGIIVYWPAEPDWIYGASAELDYTSTEWITLTRSDINPSGSPRWTSTSYDPAPGIWMISVVAPFNRDGQWGGAVGHDLPIDRITEKLGEIKIYPGAQNLIVRRDGMILVSDDYNAQIKNSLGHFHIQDTGDPFLIEYFNRVVSESGQASDDIQSGADNKRFFLANHIHDPDWFYISIIPRHSLIQIIRDSNKALFSLIIFTVFLLSLIPTIVITRVFVPPLKRIIAGIDHVSKGDLKYTFKKESAHEFHSLADALNSMVGFIRKMLNEIEAARSSLQTSEEKYRDLVENINDVIYSTDNTGKITYISPAIKINMGYAPEDLVGKTFKDLIHSSDLPHILDRFQKTLAGDIEPSEYRILAKNRTYRWIRSSSRPAYKDGQVIGISGMFTDINEQKELESQLRQSQKIEAIGTLAGGIAHDFNNILGIIIGNTELALDSMDTAHPARKPITEIYDAALRARDIVKQILSFSRQTQAERKIIDIKNLVKNELRLLRASIPTSIELKQKIDDKVDNIIGDPAQISQILMNLCANATDAMSGDDGIFGIELCNITLDSGNRSLYQNLAPGNYVKLTVSDTGPGISPDHQDRIFDPFYTTKPVGKGTGMGLSIVHGIVQAHNGIIHATSSGKGTSFEILFPGVQAQAGIESDETDEIPGGTERILFVDDEAGLLKSNCRLLENRGYTVDAVTNPIDALEMFRSQPDVFDLVITDMTMPKMSGDKLAREIMNIRPDIPVAICTGYTDKLSESEALKLGIKMYIEKPIRIKKLAVAIRKLLNGT